MLYEVITVDGGDHGIGGRHFRAEVAAVFTGGDDAQLVDAAGVGAHRTSYNFV